MKTAVHLDTSALRFYRDAPDNYCHFVLGNLFEVFVGLSEAGLLAGDLELSHNNPSTHYQQQYSMFASQPARAFVANPPAARALPIAATVNWTTFEASRDFAHHLQGFQKFVWSRLGIESSPPHQVTLIRRNRLASNRYVINEAQLARHLKRECDTRGLRFEVVDFEGMKFESQVELMSRTSVLIGIHGAGLVNSMFLPPTAAVIELLPHRRFDSLFFRWTGVSKGNRWIRVMEPSWSIPSVYNLILTWTRKGHTRTNRFYRDRNAFYEPNTLSRALGHALDDALDRGSELEIDVTLEPAERSAWRKFALLRTHRKFLLALACVVTASFWLHASLVFWVIAALCVALAFCS